MESGKSFWYAIVAVIVGAVLSFLSGIGLWITQSSYEHENSIKDRREELIVETADVFARAGRIKGLVHGHLLQITTSNAISSLCISLKMQGKESEECNKEIDYSVMNEFNKEIFEYNAKYIKLKSLIPLYFCEETKKKFYSIEANASWWDVTPEKTMEILNVMHREYECNL